MGLGSAVMLLRGVVDRINMALNKNNLDDLIKETIYTNQVCNAYFHASKKAPKSSLITKKYILLGNFTLNEIDKLNQIIINKLQNKLRK